MRAPLQRFGFFVAVAQCHEPGHFGLGDGDFVASPLGEGDVRYFVIIVRHEQAI